VIVEAMRSQTMGERANKRDASDVAQDVLQAPARHRTRGPNGLPTPTVICFRSLVPLFWARRPSN
jgi:hypothetical protein